MMLVFALASLAACFLAVSLLALATDTLAKWLEGDD